MSEWSKLTRPRQPSWVNAPMWIKELAQDRSERYGITYEEAIADLVDMAAFEQPPADADAES